MSRCFPFPPPGYVRKTTNALHLNPIKKEKHRENKPKKGKRDKEKKESKENGDKERSDNKHKKDKQEKHKYKKTEKNWDKVDQKNDIFLGDDKRVVGPPVGLILIPSEKSKERGSDRSANLAEKRVAGLSAFCYGEQVSKNNLPVSESKNNPFISENKSVGYASELVQRGTDKKRKTINKKKETINQSPNKNFGAASKDCQMAKLGGITAGPRVDGKEKNEENAPLDGRINRCGIVGEARSSESTLVPDSVGIVQHKVGGGKPMEKKVGPKVEEKEKIRDEQVDDRKGDKQKDKDKKNQNREKEKKKKGREQVTSVQKHVAQSSIKRSSENHLLEFSVKDGYKEISSVQKVELLNTTKDGSPSVLALDNLGKRKDIGLNGLYDEHTTGPNKLARTMGSTLPLTENGRTLEPCQKSAALPKTQFPSVNVKVDGTCAANDTLRPLLNIKVEGKNSQKNGSSTMSVIRQPSQSVNAEQNSDACVNPPHPDTKYLNQVLSVPKMDKWSGFDDEEWLFNSCSSQTRKPEVNSSEMDEVPQVWAKALWLEAVDIYGLPYVIPR